MLPLMDHRLHFEIQPQPNNTTCGPTCLHAVYRYLGEEIPLLQVIEETQVLAGRRHTGGDAWL